MKLARDTSFSKRKTGAPLLLWARMQTEYPEKLRQDKKAVKQRKKEQPCG